MLCKLCWGLCMLWLCFVLICLGLYLGCWLIGFCFVVIGLGWVVDGCVVVLGLGFAGWFMWGW